MFFLYFASDNSHCLVENENVIYNEENIKKGNEVIFTYNNKEYIGRVIDHSGKVTLNLYTSLLCRNCYSL